MLYSDIYGLSIRIAFSLFAGLYADFFVYVLLDLKLINGDRLDEMAENKV